MWGASQKRSIFQRQMSMRIETIVKFMTKKIQNLVFNIVNRTLTIVLKHNISHTKAFSKELIQTLNESIFCHFLFLPKEKNVSKTSTRLYFISAAP